MTRTITRLRQICISRRIRGAEMEGQVLVYADGTSIVIAPLEHAPKPGVYCMTAHFDQFNRLTIPNAVIQQAGLAGTVEVAVNENGTMTLLPAAENTCMICGDNRELRRVRGDKYICSACIRESKKIK